MSQAALFLILLVIGWLIQLGLSYYQTMRFHKRLRHLKQQGERAAVGLVGSNWRRKVYAVLVVDADNHIVCAEQLSGWTVFANLKPVHELISQPIHRLEEEEPIGNIKKKVWQAFQKAAEFLVVRDQPVSQSSSSAGYTV